MKLSRTYVVGKVAFLCLALTMGACTSGGGDAGGGATAPVTTATISGKVTGSSSAVSTSSVHGKARKVGKMTADGCSSGTWVGKYVGEGGAEAAAGSFSSNSFEVPTVPVKKEMIITFTCNDGSAQRCLVKSGDAGVQCNAVADGVMGAYESALGVTLYDSALAGKSISKVGAAIVQAAEGDSTSVSAFKSAIETCKALTSGKEACYKDAITSSVFAGPFKLMQTMVSGWSVDALFTLMVDVYGAQINVDDFIYSGFATDMDTWLGTDFVASTRAYLASVIADQDAGGSTYVASVQCQMWYQKFQSGGKFLYSPTIVTVNGISVPTCKNHTAWAANNIPNTTTQYADMDSDIDNNQWQSRSVGTVSVNCSQGGTVWQTPGAMCVSRPNMVITSRFVEPNRNDPMGEHGGDFYDQPRVDMIRIFPEVQTALAAADPACVSMGQNGPPTITNTQACKDYFGTLMAAQKKNFAGLMGLYMFLKSPTSYDGGLLSLTDIYKLYSGTNFLNMKLALNGFNMCGGQVTGGGYLPALATMSNGLFVAQANNSCSMNGNTYSANDAAARVAAASFTYAGSFQMFEQIPSATEIRSFVFGSGFHSDWNPTGPKMYYAAQAANSGYPIFCKMTNTDTGKPKETQLDSKTAISCLTATELQNNGVAVPDANGVIDIPSDYPYTLQNYGYQGDSKGSVFALADAKTGMQVRPGNTSPILIWQINSGNGSACTSNGSNNTVATALLNFGWGSNTQQQSTPVYCMDMSNFSQASSFMMYQGGQVSIKQTSSDGMTWEWNVQQQGMRDPSVGDGNALVPICYFKDATSPAFAIDSTSKLVTTAGVASASGEITQAILAASSDVIDKCSATHNSMTKYYLVLSGMGWMSGTRENMKAHLLGTQTGDQIIQWQDWSNCGGSCDWEAMQIYLKPSVLEQALNGTLSSTHAHCASGTPPASCKAVAPASAFAPIFGVQIANQKWNAKFDPFCDDTNGNGVCDCYDAGTTNIKTAGTCTLEDDSAEPTLSQPPYNLQDPNATAYQTLFTTLGGKISGQFAAALGQTFNGSYLNNNQLWMDTNNVFQCAYKKSGETYYRKPTQLDWMNFDNSAQGCPASDGAASVTSGPVRLIQPVAANNTYAINRPNTLIKMINYATKTVGQGITIGSTDKVFTFDEALSLVALRSLMPMVGDQVYAAGTTSATPSAVLKGVVPTFRQVQLGNNDNSYDISSAVLRAITHSSELQ